MAGTGEEQTPVPSANDRDHAIEALQNQVSLLVQKLAATDSAATASGPSATAAPSLTYVPHYASLNPFARRPPNVTDKPQLCDLSNDPTHALLGSRNTQARYEYKVLECLCSYLSDCASFEKVWIPQVIPLLNAHRSRPSGTEAGGTVDAGTEVNERLDDVIWSIESTRNSHAEVFDLLAKRLDYVRLKTRSETPGQQMSSGDRTLLQSLETRLFGIVDNLTLRTPDFEHWVEDHRDKVIYAQVKLSASQTANKGKDRCKGDRQPNKGQGQGGRGRGKGGEKGGSPAPAA